MTDPSFDALGLVEPLRAALADKGHTAPTPIQVQALPPVLAGRDLCAAAPTGSGKTAAFALPILQRLATTPGEGIRALVLAPTRELAVQIDEAFGAYGAHLPTVRHGVVYGGMKPRAQRRALEAGVDVLVATPGRLLDLCAQGVVALDHVECFVLDEADRMLDLGFQQDLRAIVKRLPARRQTLLFSATLPENIVKLAAGILRDPVRVSAAPPEDRVAGHVQQVVLLVEKPDKRAQLARILADPAVTRALVFIRTRDAADRLANALRAAGVRAEAIHADRPQADRERALADFAQGTARVLVATDIAARGLHVEGVTHVVNYDVPSVPETYLHRIGRTARAGASGVAITLCAKEERGFLTAIERVLGRRLLGG
ncbi:MAG: DEAD/DEAH box helicase [Myxococcota bacterium]